MYLKVKQVIVFETNDMDLMDCKRRDAIDLFGTTDVVVTRDK